MRVSANVVLVEQDSYYRNLADMPLDERHQANFDHRIRSTATCSSII